MMHTHTEIIEHFEHLENSAKMKSFAKIIQLWNEHKTKQLLRSFDEVEPNVFVLKQEITDKIKLKAEKIKNKKLKKGNLQ